MLYTLKKDVQGSYIFAPTPFTLPISVADFDSKLREWCDRLIPYLNAIEINEEVKNDKSLSLNIPRGVLAKALKDFVDVLSDSELDLVTRSCVYTPSLIPKITTYCNLKYKKPATYDFRELRICTVCAMLETAVARVLDVEEEAAYD